MIAITRDAPWADRLGKLALRAGWSFSAVGALTDARGSNAAKRVVLLDRSCAGSSLPQSIRGLRAIFHGARVALACAEDELGVDGAGAGVVSGADDVVVKSWSDKKLGLKLESLHDAALGGELLSRDGGLKAEPRSRRVGLLVRGRWTDLNLGAAEFSLLCALLTQEGEPVSRERLLAAIGRDLRRDVEPETVARRMLSLRRCLSGWKGRILTVRGGYYKLESCRRRSKT